MRRSYLFLVALLLVAIHSTNAIAQERPDSIAARPPKDRLSGPHTPTVREQFEAKRKAGSSDLFGWFWNLDLGGTKAYSTAAMTASLGAGVVVGPIAVGFRPIDTAILYDNDRSAINTQSLEARLNLQPMLPIVLGGGIANRDKQWSGDYPIIPYDDEQHGWQPYWLAGLTTRAAGDNSNYYFTLHLRKMRQRTEVVLSVYNTR